MTQILGHINKSNPLGSCLGYDYYCISQVCQEICGKEGKFLSDHPDTKKYLSSIGIEWRFNLERAPW